MKELEYLYSLRQFGVKLGLERMRNAMEKLQNPCRKFPAIHVAGTNGKGSVCAMLSSVLQQEGYTVGLYTSPHLVRFTERIQINGVEISDDDLCFLIAEIREKTKGCELTFFEFVTTIAFLYFAQQNVDIAVIETGMGGLLDATNVLEPIASVITNVSVDHANVLGNTITEIAQKKAGIIKQDVPVFTGACNDALAVIKEVGSQRGSLVTCVGDVYSIGTGIEGTSFEYKGERYNLSLRGEHQAYNAALVVDVVRSLSNFPVSSLSIQEGLREAFWPGRLDVVSSNPFILVDGAHNVAGMKKLVQFISSFEQTKVAIIGFSQHKDVEEMVELLVNQVDYLFITQGNFKPQDPHVIASVAKRYTDKVEVVEDLSEALDTAQKMVDDASMLLVTGSLYLIGDALKILRK